MRRSLSIAVALAVVACAPASPRATIRELTTVHVLSPTGSNHDGVLYFSSELGIEPPTVVVDVQPQIPVFELESLRSSLSCSANFTVSASGEVLVAKFDPCLPPNLAPYFAQALKSRRYRPALKDGKPIPVVYQAGLYVDV